MANINEILARAAALREETALNSISPERAGSIMYDTLMALNELWLQQGAALVISKIYASVDAMEADTAPVSDISGKPLRPGQIVVIASEDEDNGSVYRYNGTDSPSWSLVGKIGNLEPVDSLDSDSTQLPLSAHQGKVLDGKISQLGQETDWLSQENIGLNLIQFSTSRLATGFIPQSQKDELAKFWLLDDVKYECILFGGNDENYNTGVALTSWGVTYADAVTAINGSSFPYLWYYFRDKATPSGNISVSDVKLAAGLDSILNDKIKAIENTLDEDLVIIEQILTSQVSYVYADDGSRVASSNYNGTTDGLIPVSVGDIISFTGILPESRHGLLFYSDEDTIVATSLIDGTFTNEKVVVENPSIRYFRAQALNANYDPSVTTQLSISLFKDIKTEVKELNERVTVIEESMSVTPDIIIEKVADGAFDVKVKQESNGKYLTHRFLRHRYSRLVRYGTTGEATHEEICSDCWYPSQIYDGTTDILQGNANFINYVANKENEQSYAGEGHGATISDYVHFFADGVEFDPNTLTGRLECGTFRMVEKNVIYAIDTTQPNFNSDNAIPKFDESGNKEISTIHWLDGVWEKNNTIKYRHRLTIKRDDTQFRYCFGAMLEMEQDNFPHIIINDADGTENLVSYENNQWTCTPINGSSVVLQSDITNKGDEIVGFGTKYIVRQRMLQALTERAKISSMFPRLYTGNSYRVKFYQQPIVTTANYAAVGLPAETFDDGDVVELFVERSIEFTD